VQPPPGTKEGKPSQGVPGKLPTPPKLAKKKKVSRAYNRLAFLVEIQDPSGLMKNTPQFLATSTTGRTEKGITRNDGKPPDPKQNDRNFTGPIHKFAGTELSSILIQSGELKWLIKVDSDEAVGAERIIIVLAKNGKTSHSFVLPPNLKTGGTPPTATKTGPTPQPHIDGGPENDGTISSLNRIGPLIITAITAVVWICIVLFFKRRKRSLGVRLEGEVAKGVFPPRRLESEQIPELLAGPLAGHRVVMVDDRETPEKTPGDGVIRCLSDFPLPDALVVAVERLAVTPGLPVALLITAQDRLTRASNMNPLERLAEEVDYRFPLWAVDGLKDWEALETAPAHEEEANASTPQDQAKN